MIWRRLGGSGAARRVCAWRSSRTAAGSISGRWRIEGVSQEREFIRSRLLPLDAYRPYEPSAEHAPAAVLVPLIERPEGLSVLLTLRTLHLRRHAGQIALPGGRADP